MAKCSKQFEKYDNEILIQFHEGKKHTFNLIP